MHLKIYFTRGHPVQNLFATRQKDILGWARSLFASRAADVLGDFTKEEKNGVASRRLSRTPRVAGLVPYTLK